MQVFIVSFLVAILTALSPLYAQDTTIDLTKNEEFMQSLKEWLTENGSGKATISQLEITENADGSKVFHVQGSQLIFGKAEFPGLFKGGIPVPASVAYGLAISKNSETGWKTNNIFVGDVITQMGMGASGLESKLNKFIGNLNRHLIDALNIHKISI